MNIEKILTSKQFMVKPTTKWIAINDPRPAFRKAFRTKRLAKLQNNGMYVTLGLVKDECEKLIVAQGLTLLHMRSTNGSGHTYPGFETVGVSEAALAQFVDALRTVVDKHL